MGGTGSKRGWACFRLERSVGAGVWADKISFFGFFRTEADALDAVT